MAALGTVLLIAAVGAARCSADNCGSTVLDQVPLIVGDLTKDPKWSCSHCHTDLPRLLAGKVGAQFWTIVAHDRENSWTPPKVTFEQIEVMKRLIAKYPENLQFVDSAAGIEEAFSEGKIGSLLAVDGGQAIDSSLSVLRQIYNLGVRSMSFTNNNNTAWSFDAAQDNTEHQGLTTFGRKVLQEMNRLGMLVDLTRSSYQSKLDMIRISQAPVFFSQSFRSPLCEKGYDRLLRMLRERRGLMMVSLCTWALDCKRKNAQLDDAVALINLVRKVAGVDHVGIGGSFDARAAFPTGLEDVSRFPALFDRLGNNTKGEQEWSDEDLRKLAGENLLRVFREVGKVRDQMANQTVIE